MSAILRTEVALPASLSALRTDKPNLMTFYIGKFYEKIIDQFQLSFKPDNFSDI
jgi:hypothetical protein